LTIRGLERLPGSVKYLHILASVILVGIEVAADPLEPLGVFVVVWISDCIEEVAVSPRTATSSGGQRPAASVRHVMARRVLALIGTKQP
jgi:hypothetical protein